MGCFAGVESTWASQLDVGRTHIATKGTVQSGLVLNLDAGASSSYSGIGNTWSDLSVGTGALPIYNTTNAYGTVKGTGTRTDANASSLVLAIPMDGTNNGTTFTDESASIRGSGSAKSITRNGDTKTVTAVSKFYGSSGYFDGSGDYLELDPSRPVVNNLDSWMLSSGSKIGTFECWVYPTAIKTPTTNYDHTSVYNRGTTYINWGIRPGGTVRFYWYQGAAAFVDSTVTIPLNQWSHIAVTIDGSTVRHWINGVSAGSAAYSFMTQDVGANAGVRTIGVAFQQPDGQFTGYLQDFRIYNGVAKYTSNFIPSGSPNNGTLVGSPTYSSANGGSLVFDGSNQYVTISDSTAIKPSSQITLAVWINPLLITSKQYIAIYRKETNFQVTPPGHLFAFQEYGTILSFGMYAGSTYTELDVAINQVDYTGKWNYLVATYDGSTKKIYTNGIQIGVETISGALNTTSTAPGIIGSAGGTLEFLDGNISQVSIYNRALSAAEVAQNYNALRGRYV